MEGPGPAGTILPESKITYIRDDDLVQPWTEAWQIAEWEGLLDTSLLEIEEQIDRIKNNWDSRVPLDNSKPFGPIAREIIAEIQQLHVPGDSDHPLLQVWRMSRDEWHKVLASCTYKKYQISSFVMHAFGETLCRIKSSRRGLPSRMVTNEMLACYRVNAKLVQQVTARDGGLLPGAREQMMLLDEDVASTTTDLGGF